ncbi:MAG: hypothetical protein M3461_02235 [Pseudomonadota bacterium]|nr:hypothetical protein [Pseudomonadota bacterium]
MYTYTIKTDALAVEIEAPTIDAAAVTFGRSAGLSGNNCREILESVSGVVGAWMWIESDDAPDGDRRGGSSPEVLQEYLADVAAREAAENQPRLEIVSRVQADTDYTIAYIDGKPVAIVEERDGGYYGFVEDGHYVENPHEQRWWYVEDGKWRHALAQRDAIIDIKEGYTLREINDGSQEVYDGDLEEAFAERQGAAAPGKR